MHLELAQNNGEPCPLWVYEGMEFLTPDMVKAGNYIESAVGRAYTTDIGEVEMFGLIPLLRAQKKRIILSPSVYSGGKLDLVLLFGGFEKNGWPAFGPDGDGCANPPASRLGDQLQVFDDCANFDGCPGNDLHDILDPDGDNTGVTVFRNLKVRDNDNLGVEAYTIEILVLIDGFSKIGFENEVLSGEDGGWPNNSPCPDSTCDPAVADCTGDPAVYGGCTLWTLKYWGWQNGIGGYPFPNTIGALVDDFNLPIEAALSLLLQWKVSKNLDVIREALGLG